MDILLRILLPIFYTLLWPALIIAVIAITAAFLNHSKKSSLLLSLGLMFVGPIMLLLWVIIFQKHDYIWVIYTHGIIAVSGVLFATWLAIAQARKKWSWLILPCWIAVLTLCIDWWFIGIMYIKNVFL